MPSLWLDRPDERAVALLNFQRDTAVNLNPAVAAAILNEGPTVSINGSWHPSLRPNELQRNSTSYPESSNSNPELMAALALDTYFSNHPLNAISMSRALQSHSTSPFMNSLFPFSSIPRLGELSSQSRSFDVSSLLQNDSFLEVSNAVQHEATVSKAFQRGREEAILSLLRFVKPQAPSVNHTAATVGGVAHEAADLASAKVPTDSVLKILGLDTRRKSKASYIDASSLDDPDEATLSKRRTRGGVIEPFPEKLHRMLRESVENGDTEVISFYPHGRAFGIHHQGRFCREIMPKYFRQSRLSSFQRQLNLYGFQRISSGPDCGGYYHELFLMGRPALCLHMRRVSTSQVTAKGVTHEPKSSVPSGASPDFYSMSPIKGGKAASSVDARY